MPAVSLKDSGAALPGSGPPAWDGRSAMVGDEGRNASAPTSSLDLEGLRMNGAKGSLDLVRTGGGAINLGAIGPGTDSDNCLT
jgi:hypothetical protein